MLWAGDRLDGATLRAPKLGVWSDQPDEGAFLEPGASVGTLAQLSQRFQLVVPEGVSGRVALSGTSRDARPVAYGETLLRVLAVSGVEAVVPTANGAVSAAVSGTKQIVAPTDGVFYRAPSLSASPYVAVGDRLTVGQAIGLIEVMKTFNPIAFGGAGFPDEAVVVQILAEDGQEVRAGEPLVVVKPLGS